MWLVYAFYNQDYLLSVLLREGQLDLEVVQRLVDLLELKEDVAAVSLQRNQVHIPAKILRIDPRQWQSRRYNNEDKKNNC